MQGWESHHEDMGK